MRTSCVVYVFVFVLSKDEIKLHILFDNTNMLLEPSFINATLDNCIQAIRFNYRTFMCVKILGLKNGQVDRAVRIQLSNAVHAWRINQCIHEEKKTRCFVRGKRVQTKLHRVTSVYSRAYHVI